MLPYSSTRQVNFSIHEDMGVAAEETTQGRTLASEIFLATLAALPSASNIRLLSTEKQHSLLEIY